MKSRILWGLVGLNAILLCVYIGQFTNMNSAVAQVRRPSDYTLITGEVTGGSSEIVYIVDSTNGQLGAMYYDDSVHRLQTMPPIDLNHTFMVAGGNQPANTPPGGYRGGAMGR